jgi:hypothetical protein
VACRNLKSDFESDRETFSDRSRQFPINRWGEGGKRGFGTFFSEFFFFFAILGAGRGEGGEGDPETRGTSCAIPSWNVPKLIFGEGETEKVSPKIVSPNKEAVFFLSLFFFLEMEYP